MNQPMTTTHQPLPASLIKPVLFIAIILICFCMTTGLTLAHNAKQSISAKFPYHSKFVDVLGAEMHYVEEGEGDPIVLVHGIPTSSYVWRNVIPHLSKDARVIAVDLIGFGKSGKPDVEYNLSTQLEYFEVFMQQLELQNITLVLHDWGGPIGFAYASRHPEKIKGLVFFETLYGPISGEDPIPKLMKIVKSDMGEEIILNQNLFIERMDLGAGTLRDLGHREMTLYRAPFPTSESRRPLLEGLRSFPIAGEPADQFLLFAQYRQYLMTNPVPKLMLYSTPGSINPKPIADFVANNFPNVTVLAVGEGMHYIQEDQPRRLGKKILKWYLQLNK